MSGKTNLEALRNIVQQQPCFNEALALLKKGREIQLILDGNQKVTLFYLENQVAIEERDALNPDIEFILQAEALRRLEDNEPMVMAQFGITVLRQILVGTIQIKVVSSLFSIMNGGYFKIVTAAGPEFMGFLAQHGFKSLTKLQKLVSSLKK